MTYDGESFHHAVQAVFNINWNRDMDHDPGQTGSRTTHRLWGSAHHVAALFIPELSPPARTQISVNTVTPRGQLFASAADVRV